MTPSSTLRAGAADSLEVDRDGTPRRGAGGYLLLHVGGRMVFGAAMMIGSLAFQREWILDGALVHDALPPFGWSLAHAGSPRVSCIRSV